MTNLSEVAEALQHALTESKKAEENLEAARAKLEPLELAAREKRDAIQVLMGQWNGLTGEAPTRKKRAPGTGRTYNQTPEAKIAAAGKRARTRAKNKNPKLTEKELIKIEKEAAAAMAQKVGG